MSTRSSIILAATFALIALPAAAQVNVVTEQNIPAGNVFAPQTPSGFVNIDNNIWFGDEAQGFRHYMPVNAGDPDPLSNQQWRFDTTEQWSLGSGPTSCLPFCGVGQAAKFDEFNVFLVSWDHTKGQPGFVGGGGLYHVSLGTVPPGSNLSPYGGVVSLAQNQLAGNLPTAVAIGPDGKAYVGFLKTNAYVSVTNIFGFDPTAATVESVGSALNGKPIYGMSFYGSDLYMVTGDGLYVVPNVVACNGNANNCGAPKLIWNCGGPCNVIVNDGRGHIYFAQNAGGSVFRYTPASAVPPVAIASGFTFVAAHTNGLGIDRDGNLRIGDNPAPEGTPNGGRLSRILAANLAPSS